MIFDFEKFSDITASVYPGGAYSLEDALSVFRYYFEQYEEHTGRPHLPIKADQIVRICRIMPYLSAENEGNCCEDISPLDYPALIDQHFRTKYRNCDYNICHFFSGKIRAMRFFEVCY